MQAYTTGAEPIPGYRLIRFLGQGSYGQVWAAVGPGGIDIALKILSVMGTRGGKELRAIGLVKKLRHPNLIPLYGYWVKDEFGNTVDGAALEGQSLRGEVTELIIAMGLGDKSLAVRLAECKKEGSPGIPVEELLRYIDGAAKAIDYLNKPVHVLGSGQPQAVSHCDIKPGNLLVVGNDVQLCDYGLARAITPDVRATAATGTGTQAYSSPEMLANRPSDHSDQYSLAISYFELRTGELPFPENEALHAHIQGRLDFGLVTPAEQAILKRATHLEPDQRFPNAGEFLLGLREANKVSGSGSIIPSGSGVSAPPAQPVSSFDDLLRPGGQIMEHELVKLIGRGGYGEVWEARTSGGIRGLACALKIVRNLDGMQGKQEQRSLELVQELEHEGLIRLRNYWLIARDGTRVPFDQQNPEPGREPYALVMATDLAVKNLLQYWQEFQNQGRSNIPVADLMRITRQSAEAIDYLNERDITHRDIKPENILLSKEMRVKISDFGLAKLLEGSGAAIHQASVGLTLAYAAPELFDNRVTRWTDQYALAITYYRLRTGNFPFPNDYGPRQMMLAHTEGRLEFAGIRPEEERVLRKATAHESQDRYPNCVLLVEALEQAHGLSASQVGVTSSTKPSDFKIPPVDKSGVRPGSRGDDPRRTLVQGFTASPPKQDSHTEPFLGGPAVTVATDSQVMAELVETASVKDTPRSNNDLQVTVIPQVMPQVAKREPKPHRGIPTPNVDEILSDSKSAWWKRVGILGGGSAAAVALVVVGYLKFFAPAPNPGPGPTPGGSGDSGKVTPIDPGLAAKDKEPTVPPVTRSKEDELRARVNQRLAAKQFAEAAGDVAKARQDKLEAAATDELDGRILTQWRTHALGQTDPTARIATVTQALAAYPTASPRLNIEGLRLDLIDDLGEAQVEQRLRERDFVGAGRTIEAALGEKRIRLPRAERVRQTISNRWTVAVREQMDAVRQEKELQKRIAGWGRILDGMPEAGLGTPDLRALRTEVYQEKAGAEVEAFRGRKDFAKASAVVQAARSAKASGEWADGLDDQIKTDWRASAEAKASPKEQTEEFDRLLAAYPNDGIAKAERDRLVEGAAISGSRESIKKFQALLKELSTANLANVRDELRGILSNRTNPADLQRKVQSLLTGLDEYDKDAKLPADAATLDALATKYGSLRTSSDDLRPLAPLYLELCERVAAALVKSVGAKTDWSKLEAATRKLKAPWSESLHAEAVTEKLNANLSVPAGDRALPTGEATGDLRAYRDYVAAARTGDAAATMKLISATAAPAWANPYRYARLLQILQGEVDRLKQGGTLAAPFTDADAAFRILSATEGFAARSAQAVTQEQLARIRLDLGLAALTKQPPDLAVGRKSLEGIGDEAIKSLPPPEEIQLRVLMGRMRDPSKPADRAAAVRGEIAIFDLLRKHNLAGVPIPYLDAEIIGPLERDGGKAIVGNPQSPEEKAQAARLFCEAGRHLLRFRNEWEREKAAGGRPIELAVQFLDRAVALEPLAEHLSWRGLLRSETSKPDMALAKKDAEAALAADKNWSGGHTLSGIVAANSGRNASDVAQRIIECNAADEQFQAAEKLATARPDSRDELAILYKAASLNDVLLASFIFDPKTRTACLDRAIARADKLLALDPSRLDMCDTKGCALEDKAWLLQPPDRFGETGDYKLAIAEFTKALGGISPRGIAQMHRGRTIFKFAEDRWIHDKTLKADALNELLAEARSDLTEALTKASESSDALEAHFWKAKIELLRLQQPLTPAQQEQAYTAAATEFKEAKRIADSLGVSMWAEPITFEWAMAALQELRRAATQSSESARSELRMKEANELAEAAKKYSKPWHAYLRMQLLPFERTGTKNKTYYDDMASRADDGLGESRQQDRRVQFLIRLLRAEHRSLLDVIGEAVKPEQALADAEAALKIAKDVPLSADDQANAYGMMGLAKIRTYLQLTGEKKEAAREKPRGDFRRALELAPDHYAAWQWKAFLGMTSRKDSMKTVLELAPYVAEAYRYYREAEEAMPSNPATNSHDFYIADLVRSSRDKLEKEHRSTLDAALREKPDHPDRVLWQLSLAEMQARTGEAAKARETLASAQTGLSADARKKHEAQIRRIEQAVKK